MKELRRIIILISLVTMLMTLSGVKSDIYKAENKLAYTDVANSVENLLPSEPKVRDEIITISPTVEPSPTPTPVDKFIEYMETVRMELEKKNEIRTQVGIYIKDISNNKVYTYNGDKTELDSTDNAVDGYFRAASVVKLPMAYVVVKLIEKGELSTTKEYYDKVTKKSYKLMTTIKTMLKRSDNDLFNILLRLVGKEKANEILEENGIINSNIYGEISPAVGYSKENNMERHRTLKVGGKITPNDMAIILNEIYEKRKDNELFKQINEALKENIWNTRIPTGIDFKNSVAHKTGTSSSYGVYNDAGIVYSKKPFIIIILTKGEDKLSAEGFIREFSKMVYNYVNKE